ncbi:MAG: hypothetical protein H6R01_947 [Burkholderiaceae bacterium]|nr:hypothetical protein [Burkholderiaceae bacterium]
MKIKFTKAFKYSPNGINVVEYAPGEHDVDDRCAAIAVSIGVAQHLACDESSTTPNGGEDQSADADGDGVQSAAAEQVDEDKSAEPVSNKAIKPPESK